MSAVGFRRMVERLGETPKMAFPSHPHMQESVSSRDRVAFEQRLLENDQ